MSSPSDQMHSLQSQHPIRILLADDHPAVRLGLRRLIDDQPDMVVVQDARSGDEAVGGEPTADVVVVDYHLGGRHDGLWVTRQLKRRPHPPRVLIYSAFADSALAAAALIAGADGLLSKTSLGEELCDAVRELSHGRRYLPSVPQPISSALCSQLASGDQAIFQMLLADVEPAEIAERLEISEAQLDDRRGVMLRTLAPAASVRSVTGAPLDYERPRRRAEYGLQRGGFRRTG